MMRYLALALLMPLVACASADPRYYTLAPVPVAVVPVSKPLRIEILRPALPGALDRADMVAGSGYSVRRDDGHVWAEPLDRMLGRTLALDLGRALPDSTVVTDDSSLGNDAYRVAVEVQRFEPDLDGRSLMVAQIAVTDSTGKSFGDGPAQTYRGPAGAPGQSMAAALSDLTAQIARHVAATLAHASGS